MSIFLEERRKYQPRYPSSLEQLGHLRAVRQELKQTSPDTKELEALFPHLAKKALICFQKEGEKIGVGGETPLRIGVVLSGGPAPGGHNVIAGLYKGVRQLPQGSALIGFKGGTSGILSEDFVEVTDALVQNYLNTGGFDLLGSGRTKLESPEQLQRCEEVLTKLQLDGLCVIGGDDSNTNAALLAEYFLNRNLHIQVIGVPKTIDGDLKNTYVDTSFGFDTAVRLYAELVSNVARDTLSAKKYYHFIKLMGRAASHITLETALLTRPNVTLISEEVWQKGQSLMDVVDDVCQVIVARAEQGKDFGVVLVPEGLIEFIPEMRTLIAEINHLLAEHAAYVPTLRGFTEQAEFFSHKLSKDASYTFAGLPIDIQRQMLMERDPHGNVIVSQIETERLLIELIQARLRELKAQGTYKGRFGYQKHFFGYEGRCAAPTNFDADYAYSLGLTATALFRSGCTGYMSVVKGLAKPQHEWQAMGVPLLGMMSMERRHGKNKPVIQRTLVDTRGPAFAYFARCRGQWAKEDDYRFAGAIQYFGPASICDRIPESLKIEFLEESQQ